MRVSFLAIIQVFTLSTLLVLAGCSKEKTPKPEGSTHVHEHGSMYKDVQGSETTQQTTCSVMGGEIDKSIYADHDGKRVYFCCPACVKEFKKIPEKYIKKLEDKGVTLEKVPTG